MLLTRPAQSPTGTGGLVRAARSQTDPERTDEMTVAIVLGPEIATSEEGTGPDLAIDTTVIETAMAGEGTGTRAVVGTGTEAQVGTVSRADEVRISPLSLLNLSRY